ncbi:hypothetical protein [Kribbella lupini]|uniref:Integral membrane protein n=1 Tax=Kribbella lupini TaxID=291602 RepID=A0ABP4KYK9_9ACTN
MGQRAVEQGVVAVGGLRRVRGLVAAYAVLSLVTLGVIVGLRKTAAVTDAVWVRGSIVAVTSVVMFGFARSAARGSARGLLRLRVMAAVMLVAIVVILVIPGDFPGWLKVEQGVCGVLLLGVVVLVSRKK